MHHAYAYAPGIDNLHGLHARIFGAERSAAAAIVAVAADGEHGHAAALLEPVEHFYDVQVAGVQDQVDVTQGVVGFVPERAGLGVVCVADEADAHHVDSLSGDRRRARRFR